MRKAEQGDTVKVNFTGRLDDGTEFANSNGDEPLEFTIGDGQLIPGFEKATVGMTEGERKTIRVEPSEGFGEKRPEMVSKVPRSAIPDHIELSEGLPLQVTTPSGEPVRVVVTDVSDEEVTLDANPPLAGLTLTFDIELVAFV